MNESIERLCQSIQTKRKWKKINKSNTHTHIRIDWKSKKKFRFQLWAKAAIQFLFRVKKIFFPIEHKTWMNVPFEFKCKLSSSDNVFMVCFLFVFPVFVFFPLVQYVFTINGGMFEKTEKNKMVRGHMKIWHQLSLLVELILFILMSIWWWWWW